MSQPAVTILGQSRCRAAAARCRSAAPTCSALLCLLAITPGRAVANDRLIGALWPDADPVARPPVVDIAGAPVEPADRSGAGQRPHRSNREGCRPRAARRSVLDRCGAVRAWRRRRARRTPLAGRHDAAVDDADERADAVARPAVRRPATCRCLVEPAAQLAGTRARAESRADRLGTPRRARPTSCWTCCEPKVASRPRGRAGRCVARPCAVPGRSARPGVCSRRGDASSCCAAVASNPRRRCAA